MNYILKINIAVTLNSHFKTSRACFILLLYITWGCIYVLWENLFKKKKVQGSSFCSTACDDLALAVLPPSFSVIQEKWALAGLDETIS